MFYCCRCQKTRVSIGGYYWYWLSSSLCMQYRGTVITAALSFIRCTSNQTYNCVLPNVSTCSEPVSLIGADLSHADSVTLSCDNGERGAR